MNPHHKKIVDEISGRWHVASFDGLTVVQAAYDIGRLCGVIDAMEEERQKQPVRPAP